MQGWGLQMQCLPLDQQKGQPCGTESSTRHPFSLFPLSPGVGALTILADERGGRMRETLLPTEASIFQSVLSWGGERLK